MHTVTAAHETARTRLVWKPGILLGVDQDLPLKVVNRPDAPTARQNDVEGQDTEGSPSGSAPVLGDHRAPLKVRAFPFRFTATQNVGVAQDTSRSRSPRVPVGTVWKDDHERPSKVAIVLGPGIPGVPTAAQNVTVGQEIL